MELRQLNYFIAVAEELHFSRAAKRVNISQPPLSIQIRNLEEELGADLFKRTSRSVELTEAGRYFLNECREILKNIQSAVETTKKIAIGSIGQLEIGTIGPAMDTFLPAIIQDFNRNNPGIVLTIRELITNKQIEYLNSGQIQVGFARIYHHELKELSHKIVWREPYVLAVPETHPFMSKRSIFLHELKGQAMIMYPRSVQPLLYDTIVKFCELAGFKPKISQEANTKYTTCALVAAGLGVAIVPESSKKIYREGVNYLPITDSLPMVEFSMVWKQNNDSPVLKRFFKSMSKLKHAPVPESRVSPTR